MTKKEYRDAYKQEEAIQYLEDKASFDFSKECKNKKALFLVDIMAKQHIGYKLEYKNLACKRWSNWVKDNPSFTSSDMLNPADIKAAVREFYRQVATGELSWADGIKRQLEFTRSIDGLMELRVIGFIEDYFTDTSKIEKVTENEVVEEVKEEKVTQKDVEAMLEEIDVIASIEAMLQSKIGVGERAVLQKALDDLKIMTRKSA